MSPASLCIMSSEKRFRSVFVEVLPEFDGVKVGELWIKYPSHEEDLHLVCFDYIWS